MAITEIDYMEYSSDANAQAAYVSNSFYSNADIDSEDMADITDWTDGSYGTAATSQVTFDSKSCMKLDTGGDTGSESKSSQDLGTFGTRTVFSYNVYFDNIGTYAGNNRFTVNHYNGSINFQCFFGTDGLFINADAGASEVGTDLVALDTWQQWTFDVDWSGGTVDVYLDNVLKAADVNCSRTPSSTDGIVAFSLYNSSVANMVVYIDWFKAGTNLALQSFSESTIKTQGSYSLKCIATTDTLNKTLTKTF